MASYGTIIIGAGVATVVISGSVIGGIIAKVLNDGDNHKTKMTTAPPPPHPGRRRRCPRGKRRGSSS